MSKQVATRPASTGTAIVVVAIMVAAAVSFANGVVQGDAWSDAARDIAYWGKRGTGSLGWMDQIGAILALWLGGMLLALVACAIVRCCIPSPRTFACVSAIAAITAAMSIAFLARAGGGGELGIDPNDVPPLIGSTAFIVSLGALMGYGVGSMLRPPARRPGA